MGSGVAETQNLFESRRGQKICDSLASAVCCWPNTRTPRPCAGIRSGMRGAAKRSMYGRVGAALLGNCEWNRAVDDALRVCHRKTTIPYKPAVDYRHTVVRRSRQLVQD